MPGTVNVWNGPGLKSSMRGMFHARSAPMESSQHGPLHAWDVPGLELSMHGAIQAWNISGMQGPLLGGLPISPSWANRPPISLRGILTYMPYGLRRPYALPYVAA
jgi:hypothetical protein